ncbi:chorismate-binding protein [Saccharicrinis fermentans]|uniref:Isochorismate synthase EntC n=1 Tax=Saccharicrinis fermentans DSM 9555 = JCM 21142 TaxID=869213 RepID=W7Y4D5_9BACT|nr:chorismate-binding protein [Saccharicrinis fermentans]GAF02957.1 isochorismate synthase EntC [Saccharicrinis fermentans DSM 9555 = JCM 21142]
MEKDDQSELLKYCIAHYIPFAIYNLPHSGEDVLVISKKVIEKDLNDVFSNDDTFVIAPFSLQQSKIICLNIDLQITSSKVNKSVWDEIKQISACPETNSVDSFYADYVDYTHQFSRLYEYIESGAISKAILSRIKRYSALDREKASAFYDTLSQTYPGAYTFMFYTPQTGLWTGASPEILFKAEQGQGTTVALAGTRKDNGQVNRNWDKKEMDEQQIVTDFVTGVLSKYGIENAQVKGPETIVAGKMSHLKTQYAFPTDSLTTRMGAFINDLHPTPAVCGLPKALSMKVIHEVEQHERSFYAGFVGRIQAHDIKLFVNIRSMKFVQDGVDLYLGGGITSGSEVKKEWQETELKAETMLNVIRKVNEV